MSIKTKMIVNAIIFTALSILTISTNADEFGVDITPNTDVKLYE